MKGFFRHVRVSEWKGKVLLSLLKICHNESHFDILMSWKRPLISAENLVKEIPAPHPLAQPAAAWDWEGKLWAFLSQLPSGDTPAGDALQSESQRAFRPLRAFRFPFPEGNWLASHPWKLPPSVSLLTTNTETAHLLPQQRKHTRQVNKAVRHVQESWK